MLKEISSILNIISFDVATSSCKYSVHSLGTNFTHSPFFLTQQPLCLQVFEQEFFLMYLSSEKTKVKNRKAFPLSSFVINYVLTDLLGSIYAFKRDLIVGYFFQMATANLGCTFGIEINAFNLHQKTTVKNKK